MGEFYYSHFELIVCFIFGFFATTTLACFIINKYIVYFIPILMLTGLLLMSCMINYVYSDDFNDKPNKSNEKTYTVITKVHDDAYQLVLENSRNHRDIVEVQKSDYQKIKENQKVKMSVYEDKAVLNQ